MPKLLASIFLASLLSCTSAISTQEREADLRAVLQQVVGDYRLSKYLANRSGALLFHYEELPVHNGFHMEKPRFNLKTQALGLVEYSNRDKDEINNTMIIVNRVSIAHDSAQVYLSIPKQGQAAQFRLTRQAAHDWRVLHASVVYH